MINVELENIIAVIIAALPSITAIIGCISACIKIKSNNDTNSKDLTNKFEELRDEILKTKEYEDLKAQLQIVNQENIDLKKDIRTLIRKIDRINRGDKNEWKD